MLHYREFRQVVTLLDRCLQVGADPDGWRHALAAGLRELFHAQVILTGEFKDIYDDDRAQVLHLVDVGWEVPEHKGHFISYQVEGAQRVDPARTILGKRRAAFVATATSRLVDFEEYKRSEVYRRYMAPGRVGDTLIGITTIDGADGGRSNLTSCVRTDRDPTFSHHEIALWRVLQIALAPLVGTRLADSTSPVMQLTPRQHHVLRLLLEGYAEPIAATEMGIGRTTFHKYVTELYRRFGVNSRAELQASFAGRGRLSTEREQAFDPRQHRVRREGAPMAKPWRSPRTFGKRNAQGPKPAPAADTGA